LRNARIVNPSFAFCSRSISPLSLPNPALSSSHFLLLESGEKRAPHFRSHYNGGGIVAMTGDVLTAALVLAAALLAVLAVFFAMQAACIYLCCIADTPLKKMNSNQPVSLHNIVVY